MRSVPANDGRTFEPLSRNRWAKPSFAHVAAGPPDRMRRGIGRILNDWDEIANGPPIMARLWRRQIRRQPKTNLTIADFCRQHGVSVPTFCYRKRRVQAGLWTPSEPVAEVS